MKKTFQFRFFALSVAILALALYAGCSSNDSNPEAQSSLKDSVLSVHDEVMPLMSDIHQIQKSLKSYLEEAAPPDSATVNEISNTLISLELADEGMMSWMSQFKQPASLRDSLSHEEIMTYLGGEKEKIGKVKTDILSSIELGSTLLAKLEKEKKG